MNFRALGALVALIIGIGLIHPVSVPAAEPKSPAPVYTVAKYDAKRDPEKDLAMTVKRAQAEKKRILMIVGGNWCGWCRRLDRYFEDKPAVAAELARHYLVMKVNYDDDNPNLVFLQDYPEINDFPHFYVLAADGKVLRSQSGSGWERFGSYRESAMLEFLRKWAGQPGAKLPDSPRSTKSTKSPDLR